ncbi:MAG: hypothetical protein WCJ59_01810 [bacterium]
MIYPRPVDYPIDYCFEGEEFEKNGKRLEQSFFGFTFKNENLNRQFVIDYYRSNIGFGEALAQVMIYGPNFFPNWNSSLPDNNTYAKWLYFQVRQTLTDLKIPGDLKIYPCLGFPFDVCHGVDGFFKLGDTKYCFFDVTAFRPPDDPLKSQPNVVVIHEVEIGYMYRPHAEELINKIVDQLKD